MLSVCTNPLLDTFLPFLWFFWHYMVWKRPVKVKHNIVCDLWTVKYNHRTSGRLTKFNIIYRTFSLWYTKQLLTLHFVFTLVPGPELRFCFAKQQFDLRDTKKTKEKPHTKSSLVVMTYLIIEALCCGVPLGSVISPLLLSINCSGFTYSTSRDQSGNVIPLFNPSNCQIQFWY